MVILGQKLAFSNPNLLTDFSDFCFCNSDDNYMKQFDHLRVDPAEGQPGGHPPAQEPGGLYLNILLLNLDDKYK